MQVGRYWVAGLLSIASFAGALLAANERVLLLNAAHSLTSGRCKAFEQNPYQVCGPFFTYWETNSGPSRLGMPVSAPANMQSETDGKSYYMQYFEWGRLELHSDSEPPNNVLLSPIGTLLYRTRYPQPEGAPGQEKLNVPDTILFKETGKHVGGLFLAYWNEHGGHASQGFPVSEQFEELLPNGTGTHIVQYFERAVYSYWPQFSGSMRVSALPVGRIYKELDQHGVAPCDTELSFNGKASPQVVDIGQQVEIYAWGSSRPEPVSVSVRVPGGTWQPLADYINPVILEDGEPLIYTVQSGDPTGQYLVHLEGLFTRSVSQAVFCVR